MIAYQARTARCGGLVAKRHLNLPWPSQGGYNAVARIGNPTHGYKRRTRYRVAIGSGFFFNAERLYI